MANDTSTRTARRQNKPKKPILKRILLSILLFILIIGVGIGALFTFYIIKAPDLDPEELTNPFVSEIYDMDGEFVTDRGGSEKRKKIQYDDLPEELIQAVIATEDSRFFEHPGIDIPRIFGAIKANIVNGFGSEGASTITQQVVENAFLTPDKTIELKVQEQWLALKLEREYSKEEIMEMYLNTIFYGSNAYGVAKASEIYFGKTDLHDLTLTESAMLAGLPQRPSAYNPYENPDLMEGRVDTVLKLMVRHDKITQAEADEARSVDIASTLSGERPAARKHDGFVQQVEKEVKEKLDGADINTDGLKIHTTLDTKAQKHVESLLTEDSQNLINFPDEDMEAGLSVVDNETGAVRAIGGSRHNNDIDGFNYAIDLQRQGGSTMKPLLSYAPAIEYEKWSTYEQIKDEPFKPEGRNEVRNYDRQHHGWMSIRDALAKSYNVPAVKTFQEVGSERVHEFGTNLGINFPNETVDFLDVIGGTDTNVTPLELASAYSAFANEGNYTEAYTITKVEFQDGTTVDLTPEPEQAMEDYTAYMVTDMLKTAITEGTGTNANIPGLDVAGKTGTTNGPKDSWFTGYTSKYTISAWTGYEDGRAIDNTQIPHALFKNTMSEISKDIDTPDFSKPDSVVEVNVAKGSNPAAIASSGQSSIKELFVKGTEPDSSTIVKEESYPSVKNLSANYNEDENQIDISWSHEDSEATFEVSSAIDQNSMKVEETTSSTEATLSNIEDGVTYTIQLVAISDDGEKSDSETVTVKVGEEDKEEEIPAVTNLSANLVDNNINVTWNYDGPEATFEVEANGSNDSVSDNNYKINNPETDTEYKITVTAVSNDEKGPPSTVSIRVEEPESDTEEDSEENQEEDSNENEDQNTNENSTENNSSENNGDSEVNNSENNQVEENNNQNENNENTNDAESDGP